ncbi:MAG TPA: DeoR/GlpR family DNA-binding transcription regulator [Saprospiraceae bacterium]|nr:DeoR/GlpR family DNA-binding transcription regulator [Saprospiraceae bacterium]HMP23137.1 DeoR/GlpR family DNA-binding transcription regulator [Saprospiraceae bacterium]
MLKEERHRLILREVNIHNKVLIADLTDKFDVSEDTVRRDLHELANSGKIQKVRGGALSKSYSGYSYHEQDIYAYREKNLIARKAVSLLKDGMLVLISGGSTNLEIARLVPPELKVTFLTVSLSTAMQLLEHPVSETIFIGGQLSKSAKISVGGEVIGKLSEVRPDICFLGTNGIDASAGITESDWEVVIVKKAMIQASSKVVLCAIAEKLNTVQRIKVCDMSQIDLLVTELDPQSELLTSYRNTGVQLA